MRKWRGRQCQQTRSAVAPRPGARLVVLAMVMAVVASCAPAAPPSLAELKRSEFGARAQFDAQQIAAGLAEPVLPFTVEDTPPSIFVNYVVPDDRAAAFASFIDLPPGFTLAKVRILEGDATPQYWLSLNVYRVSGITTGLRAEWSTYVDDGSGTPRFMIIRARASEGSLDPIGPLALPEPFDHTLGNDNVIRTDMLRTEVENGVPVVTGDPLFDSTIALPAVADRHFVQPTLEWVEANDFIYWMNGVNDRIFHNSTSHSPPLLSIDPASVTISDHTEWTPYIDPSPGHVLVYLDKLQFMIGPWWNITRPDGRVAPSTLASLADLKKTIYGGLSSVTALNVLTGDAEPTVQSSVDAGLPSVYWHWRIPPARLGAFESAAHLPAGLSLATVRLQDSDPAPDHWLTLNVFRTSSPSSGSGVHAEWSTYVDDATGTHAFTLEARADFATLDPVNRFSSPYPITHTFGGGSIATTVGAGPAAFSSSFVVPPAGPGNAASASRAWVGARDLRYWSNGVADRNFYDTRVFNPKIAVDPSTVPVVNGGQWSAFAAGTPDQVWVDTNGVDIVTNPWWRLNGN